MAASLQFEEWVSFPLERVFEFFANPRNLPRIMPLATDTRIEQLKLVAPSPSPLRSQTRKADLAGVGSEIFTSFLVLPPLPFRTSWVAAISEFEWNHHFADIQKEGPFRRWRHRHEFASDTRRGIQGTVVRDVIEYEAGFGFAGLLAEKLFISGQMRRTFAHRQRVLASLLQETAP
jgi:ligand-binding SRPBCC domain-containing protein